jgi:hypothetical protein
MHAVHQRIDRGNQITTRWAVQQGGIIPNAQADVRTFGSAVAEVTVNESKL